MSIYFYASQNSEIKALCGVKALIIPIETAKKIKNKLDSIIKKQLPGKQLEVEYKRCLEKEFRSLALQEEYNHFKCLVQSKTANFFHIRNIMLRYSFTSYILKKITSPTLRPHSVFRDVLKYFIDYAYFHHAAFPFIEAHHLLLSGEAKSKKRGEILYSQRIEKALHFFNDYPGEFNNKETSFHNVGRLADRNFCLLLKWGRETFANLEYKRDIDKKYLRRCNPYFLLYHMFAGFLRRPGLWVKIALGLLTRIKIIYPYILGRLFPGIVQKGNTGVLPAIIFNNESIDPVGFAYNKLTVKSMETPYPSPLHGGLANLLWHTLSRSAVIYCLLSLDVPENELNDYFKKLRRFNWKWREKTRDAEFEMAHLDSVIIERVTEFYSKSQQHSPQESILHLEGIALDIFKEYRLKKNGGEDFFNFNDTSFPHHRAMNCSYMHI